MRPEKAGGEENMLLLRKYRSHPETEAKQKE